MRDGSRWVVLTLYQRAAAFFLSVCPLAASAFLHLQACLRCACEADPLCEVCDLLQLEQPFVWFCYLTMIGQVWKRIWKLLPVCVQEAVKLIFLRMFTTFTLLEQLWPTLVCCEKTTFLMHNKLICRQIIHFLIMCKIKPIFHCITFLSKDDPVWLINTLLKTTEKKREYLPVFLIFSLKYLGYTLQIHNSNTNKSLLSDPHKLVQSWAEARKVLYSHLTVRWQ